MLNIQKSAQTAVVRLVAVSAALMMALSGSVALADETLSISAAPASGGEIDETRSRFSYQLDPGQSVSDEYFIQNSGSVDQKIIVYATDAFNSENGDFALLDTAEAPTDVGTWIAFDGGVSRVEFTLQAGESKIVGFTLAVPAEASPGDHAGGIVVSAQSEAGQVTLDRRIATRGSTQESRENWSRSFRLVRLRLSTTESFSILLAVQPRLRPLSQIQETSR